MNKQKGRAWKMERATVHVAGRKRPRSNKYSRSDSAKKPPAGTRKQIWVGGYRRADGRRVEGHYRSLRAASAGR